MGRFSLPVLSERNRYITQCYVFYLNSNEPLSVDPFQALYAFKCYQIDNSHSLSLAE